MLPTVLLAAQVLTASDLRPAGFYVAGVQQGMSLADYNAMIANGRYRSQPMGPDHYVATINGQDVIVRFCAGRVVGAAGQYSSADWLRSIQVLEGAGFKWVPPIVSTEENTIRTGTLAIGTTTPKGFAYGVLPEIKSASIQGKDIPAFMLYFEALENPCRK